MTIQNLERMWDKQCETHTQKIVLLALADGTNDDNQCCMPMPFLAKRCCMTENGARNQIRDLVRLGHVKVEVGGGKAISRYTIQIKG